MNEDDLYKMEPKSKHHMIITVSDLKIDIPEIQNIIAKFNNKNYNSYELKNIQYIIEQGNTTIKIRILMTQKRH